MSEVERRPGGVETELVEVKGRLGNVEARLESVETGVTELRGEVQKLRVLGEHTAGRVTLVAEVQTRHGERLETHGQMLEQIARALEPMKVVPGAVQQIARDMGFLKDFIQRVAPEHEARITELEKGAGVPERPSLGGGGRE